MGLHPKCFENDFISMIRKEKYDFRETNSILDYKSIFVYLELNLSINKLKITLLIYCTTLRLLTKRYLILTVILNLKITN